MILLGKIDDVDEVYINGKQIGSTGRIERKWITGEEYQQYRNYHIPDGVLKPGKSNVIAVRVYDHDGAGGIYEGPVTLLPHCITYDATFSFAAIKKTGILPPKN